MRGIIMKKGTSSRKILLCTLLISLAAILLSYLGFVIYFSNHFLFHTEINGIDASGMTVKELEDVFAQEVATYSLQLQGRNDLTDSISASDISMKYTTSDEISNLLKKQNQFLWLGSAFHSTKKDVTHCISYDEQQLKERCKSLSFLKKENVVAPKNATITYLKNQGYCLVSENAGTKVNKKKLLEQIKEAILTLEPTLSLEKEDCYVKPAITSETPELKNLYEKVQRYASAEITYTFGKKKVVVDHKKIHNWITIQNKKFKASIDKEKVRAYIDTLASTYNTYGRSRTFSASTGKTATVTGGDYGWLMDREKETSALIKLIKKGTKKKKKPVYAQTAVSYGKTDWGKTYVEINLSQQHLWYYKNKKLVVDSDFVSGNISKGYDTPQGVYSIMYLERNAILGARSNADYRTPVSYWMPFNGGIGMHDATWRSKFGGSIYRTNGSHGCINLPKAVAATIFENISSKTPVICYFDS